LEFKKRFPAAYAAYRAYCLETMAKAKAKRELKAKTTRGGGPSREGDNEDEDEYEDEEDEDGESEEEGVGSVMMTFTTDGNAEAKTDANRRTNTNTTPSTRLTSTTSTTTTTTTTKNKIIIANLFTRTSYGPPTPTERRRAIRTGIPHTTRILHATSRAMTALLQLIAQLLNTGVLRVEDVAGMEVRMPMINSGAFRVPWEETARVVRGVRVPRRLRGTGAARVGVACLPGVERGGEGVGVEV